MLVEEGGAKWRRGWMSKGLAREQGQRKEEEGRQGF